MTQGSLEHITVIDFSRFRAGPWCTNLLGELGAEVIKVERPGVGDAERHSFPEQEGMGVSFIPRNRNKKSVTIDMKTDEGRQLVEDLIADADVVVENFSLGVLERLGLGYDYLQEEVNPGLIYGSIKGYGEKGPYKDRKGVDLVMQAEGGLMSVTGTEDGDVVKVGQAIGDIGAGLFTTVGILSALNHRERTGEGQKVETSLFGTIVSFMEEYLTMYGMTGDDPGPLGTRHQTGVPYELFDTADGQMVIHVPSRRWQEFATDVLDAPDLAEYDSQQQRQEHYDEIMEVLRPKLRERTTEEWRGILDELGCPNGPLNQVSDVVEHPQARDRGYVFEYEDENIGEVTMQGHPFHLSETPGSVRSGPPLLGEHTGEVLREKLGLSDDELETLVEKDAIAGDV
ncbi:CaiB/BaiF CoA transferase family protein [Halopenitus salinus]|uniref:CaiB/BaiF CoA transferase family protein n=1 Tax=Halopenitus salinus TaxID=1198295 RepID=A0ABD5UTW0_9EURY